MNYAVTFLSILALVGVAHSTCIKGYTQYRDKCYKVSAINDYTIFVTAASLCQNLGGDLVSITDAFVDRFVSDLAGLDGAADYWIGLRCNHGNFSSCHWIDETPFKYNNFYFGYPATNGDCAATSLQFLSKRHGKWFTSSCLSLFRYVCEKPTIETTTTRKIKTSTIAPTTASNVTIASTESSNGINAFSEGQLHPKNLKKSG